MAKPGPPCTVDRSKDSIRCSACNVMYPNGAAWREHEPACSIVHNRMGLLRYVGDTDETSR